MALIPLTPQQAQQYAQYLASQQQPQQQASGYTSTPPPQPSSLNQAFSTAGQAVNALGPLASQVQGLGPAAGILGGGANIGAALTNPYYNTAQQALGTAQGATQLAQGANALSGGALLGSAGAYAPYVAGVLGLGQALANSNAPDNVRYGQAVQGLGALATPALTAGMVTGFGAPAASSMATGAATGASVASMAAAAPVVALYIYGLASLVSHLTKSDYYDKRQHEASGFNNMLPWFINAIRGAKTEEELADVLKKAETGDFNMTLAPRGITPPTTGVWQGGANGGFAPGSLGHLGPQMGFNEGDLEHMVRQFIANQSNLIRAAQGGDQQAQQVLASGLGQTAFSSDLARLFGPSGGPAVAAIQGRLSPDKFTDLWEQAAAMNWGGGFGDKRDVRGLAIADPARRAALQQQLQAMGFGPRGPQVMPREAGRMQGMSPLAPTPGGKTRLPMPPPTPTPSPTVQPQHSPTIMGRIPQPQPLPTPVAQLDQQLPINRLPYQPSPTFTS